MKINKYKIVLIKIQLIILSFLPYFSHAKWAEDLLKTLTLEQKIGQLFIVAVDNSDFIYSQKNSDSENVFDNIINGNFNKKFGIKDAERLIKNYSIGGVHFFGYGTISNAYKAIKKLQGISDIPLFISQDFEWGLNMRLIDALRFPKNMTLGAIQDNNLIYRLGNEIGKQCQLLGVNINFAPVIDINSNPENPVIGDRSFGDDKENVAQKGICLMKGLQDAGIIACAKHFPGHGDTNIDSHLDLPVINNSFLQILNLELYPFKKLIESGIKSVMIAHVCVPDLDKEKNLPVTLSKIAITDLLKNQLAFDGLIITDALNMKGITKYFKSGEIEVQAFLAGNDILLMSQDVEKAISLIKNAVLQSKISLEELNNRVLKILKTKENIRLNKKVHNKKFSYSSFYAAHFKELKNKLYESAITLVKDDEKNLPVNIEENIALLQFGKEEKSNFYKQLNLAHSKMNNFLIKKDISDKEISLLLSNLKNYKKIVVGIFDLNGSAKLNYGFDEKILKILNALRQNGKKIIITLFGNPYLLKYFKNFSTVLVTYEDDRSAQLAAAKIILGQINPIGKLPIKINES